MKLALERLDNMSEAQILLDFLSGREEDTMSRVFVNLEVALTPMNAGRIQQ